MLPGFHASRSQSRFLSAFMYSSPLTLDLPSESPFSFRNILGWKLPTPGCVGDVDGGGSSDGGDYC